MEKLKVKKNAKDDFKKPDRLIISKRKTAFFAFIAFIGILLCLEIGVRIVAFFIYNQSPYFLFYGFDSVMADDHPETEEGGHSAAFNGYFKFPPNIILHQYGMFKKPTPIKINSKGFRSTNFDAEKPNGVFRVICLGGSSTFGYFNRDEYTYPAILQQIFAERSDLKKVEVINAGIPHATSDNLLAMFEGELLSFSPDVITIYSGYNDTYYLIDANILQRILTWVHSHSAFYVAIKRLIAVIGGPELHSRWTTYKKKSNRKSIISVCPEYP